MNTENFAKVKTNVQLDEASREAWEERAAIAEYDGGLSRKDAEALAWDSVKNLITNQQEPPK